jgi:hypothetical protein
MPGIRQAIACTVEMYGGVVGEHALDSDSVAVMNAIARRRNPTAVAGSGSV